MQHGLVRDFIFLIAGGGLTAIGVVLRARFEAKEAMRQALYLYLEVRHMANLLDETHHKRRFELLWKKVQEKCGPIDFQSEEAKLMEPVIQESITKSITIQLKSGIATVGKDYLSVLSNIAKQAPLLAYTLSGRQNIWEFINQIREYFESATKVVPQKNIGSIPILNQMRSQITRKMLDDIDQDILALAWRIGPFTWLKSRRFIGPKAEAGAEIEILKELDKLFNDLIKQQSVPPTQPQPT